MKAGKSSSRKGEHECFYQRSGRDDLFDAYALLDGVVVFHESGGDMYAIAELVLGLRINDRKTAEEAQGDIEVEFEP